MSPMMRHVALPSLTSVAFLAIAATPVEVLGCANRGLAALAVALVSGLGSVAAALAGLGDRVRGNEGTGWWVASSLVLAVPVVALLVLA